MTRQAKEQQVPEAELRAFWRRRAAQLNWTSQILDQAVPERPSTGRLYRELVSEEALTGDASTFTRRDVLRALAERLATGATVEQVEQLADAIIGHDPHQVIPLGVARGQLAVLDVIRRRDGTVVPADCGETRYTTAGLLLVEQRAIAHALNRRDVNAATVDAATTEASIRRRTLSDEQAAMVRQLTGSGHGVEVVVGKAGTGKTYALDAARAAWQAAGIRVVGVALAARAALELQDATGIPATTLTRLLARLEEGQAGSPLAPGSVLVVDEAGMVGTRTLARLLDHAQSAGVKTVLVGDPHQLPEIGAGGLFRAMTTRLDAVELADNRRQHEAWEVAALDQLRHGDPTQALAAYRQHGRLVTAETAEAVREQLVVDWWDAFDQLGATSAVMVALRRADVDDLNARARARLLAAGQLTGPKFQIDEVTFQAGDRLVCLKNDRRIGVVNGTRATITTVHPTVRTVDVTTDDGRELTLPSGYLEGGHVTHGYAITGHKAQGLTVDHTFVLGSPELYREWGYVALSRGRATNRLYVCHGGYDDEELDRHVPEAPTDPVASRAARLQRSRAQQPVSDDTLQLADRWRRLHARLHAPDIARHRELTERRERLVEDRDSLLAQLARLQGRIDSFRGRLGRWRRREDLARLEHDHRTRAGHLKRIEAGISEVDVELAGLPTGAQIGHLRDEYRKATTALGQTVSERVAGYQHLCPGYLGAPPDDAQGLHRWRQTAMAVERYRLRWDITDLDRPLGPEPNNPLQRDEHRFAVQILNEARRQLNRELEPDRYRRLERGLGR